jgi:hypothetical protein
MQAPEPRCGVSLSYSHCFLLDQDRFARSSTTFPSPWCLAVTYLAPQVIRLPHAPDLTQIAGKSGVPLGSQQGRNTISTDVHLNQSIQMLILFAGLKTLPTSRIRERIIQSRDQQKDT